MQCEDEKMDKFLEPMAKAIDERMERFGGKLLKQTRWQRPRR